MDSRFWDDNFLSRAQSFFRKKGKESSSDSSSSDGSDSSDDDEDEKPKKGEKRKADDIEAEVPAPKKQKVENGGSKPVNPEEEGITKVFIGNLSFDITDDQVKEFFKDAGMFKLIPSTLACY